MSHEVLWIVKHSPSTGYIRSLLLGGCNFHYSSLMHVGGAIVQIFHIRESDATLFPLSVLLPEASCQTLITRANTVRDWNEVRLVQVRLAYNCTLPLPIWVLQHFIFEICVRNKIYGCSSASLMLKYREAGNLSAFYLVLGPFLKNVDREVWFRLKSIKETSAPRKLLLSWRAR